MIYYNGHTESWEDTTDGSWVWGVTPDFEHDTSKEFETQEEFLKWFNGLQEGTTMIRFGKKFETDSVTFTICLSMILGTIILIVAMATGNLK